MSKIVTSVLRNKAASAIMKIIGLLAYVALIAAVITTYNHVGLK